MPAAVSSPTRFSGKLFVKALFALPLCAALTFTSTADKVKADPLSNGIGGAIGGAIIGGAVKGKKGIGPGALIGFGVGVAAGAAAEEDRRRRAAARRHYREQRAYQERAYVRRGPAPEPLYDSGLVYETQMELQRLGYNPGPADGVYGPNTADALATYEEDYALPVTGEPSPQLLAHMRRHEG